MDMGDFLYEQLPVGARVADEAVGFPLKQLTGVLGGPFTSLKGAIDGFASLVDVDTCPVSQLPLLAEMLGFDFPYDLSEAQQRAFVRSIVGLYRIKGTPAALKFVVTRLIGNGFQLDITNEDHIAKTFTLQLTANQSNTVLNALEGKVAYLVNLYKPAGMIPTLASVYYFDETAPTGNRSDAEHTSRQYDAWRTNTPGHILNTIKLNGDVVSCNNRGSQPLTI